MCSFVFIAIDVVHNAGGVVLRTLLDTRRLHACDRRVGRKLPRRAHFENVALRANTIDELTHKLNVRIAICAGISNYRLKFDFCA